MPPAKKPHHWVLSAPIAGIALAAWLVAPSSSAETTAGDPDDQLQEVVVTGSLIARPDVQGAEAVTIVTMDSLKDQGVATIEQALALISANQTRNYQTSSAIGQFTGGISTAGLRGLNPAETLILLDGQRLADNVYTGAGVDLNIIPFAAIDRIEVLREGASSLYGTDAIAGVINFITRKNYDQGELNIIGTKAEDGGGGGTGADFTFGRGNLETDGYNVMVTGNYTYQAELRASQRDFSRGGFDPARGLTYTNGSGTTPGSYFDDNGNQYQVGYPACAGNPYPTRYYGNCAYVYPAAVDLIPKAVRESGLVSLGKTLPANHTVRLQYFYARSQESAWYGPSEYDALQNPGDTYFPTAAASTCVGACSGPPDLANPVVSEWTDPRNSRESQWTDVEQRILLTLEGSNGGWAYATSFNFSLNHNVTTVLTGFADVSVLAPGFALSPLINPYGPQTAAGEAVIQSSYRNGDLGVGTLRDWSFNAHATHDLGDAFRTSRPVTLALGVEIRGEHISYTTTSLADALETTSGTTPAASQGGRTEQAAYVELNVPVTPQFEFTLSDRQDRYSDFGNSNSPKISLRYQPFDRLTIRGAAYTGFSAPSLVNLYFPLGFGTSTQMTGPGCATGNYTAVFTQSNCAAQGLALSGGNLKLKPETSENFDIGIAVEPVPDLNITLDWYRIVLKNEIQSIPTTAIYNDPTLYAKYYVLNNAGTLTQASAQGLDCMPYTSPTCGYIVTLFENTAGTQTEGFDFNANYLLRTSAGNFKVRFEGNLITRFLYMPYQNAAELNLVGQFNQGSEPVLRWSHHMNIEWNRGRWGAGVSNHFLSSYKDYALYADGSVHTVANYSVWGMRGSWKPVETMTLLLGVDNVLGTRPPFSNQPLDWQSGYNPQFSDPTGRAFYARLQYDF